MSTGYRPYHPISLIVALLAVPAIGYCGGLLIHTKFDVGWLRGLQHMGRMADYWLKRGVTSADAACKHELFRSGSEAFCERNEIIHWLRDASLVVGTTSVALIGLVALTAYLCRGERDRLAAVFPIAWWVFFAALVALVPLHGGILTYSVYVIEEVLLDGGNTTHIVLLTLSLVIVTATVVWIGLGFFRRSVPAIVGREIDAASNRPLMALVAGIAGRLRAPMPHHVIVGLEPTFYVTAEQYLIEEDRLVSGQVLYLSLPLMRVVSEQELGAIVAHELGHLGSGDLAYNERFKPLIARLTRMLEALEEIEFPILTWPIRASLHFFLERFWIARAAISREEELRADAAAASLVGARAFGSALAKFAAYSVFWSEVLHDDERHLSEGRRLANMSARFRQAVERAAGERLTDEFLEHVQSTELAHPTDTHPPLRARLKALGLDPRKAITEGLRLPAKPASALLADVHVIEEALTRLDQDVAIAMATA